tara:strand:- start:583 stop:975 length:393 start_codon:yes stop_codon:yes gene_type:complete
MLNNCICGSGKAFSQCCEPLLSGKIRAKTPEQLMRSRYSAYALGGYGDYLLKTWFAPMAKGLTAQALSEKAQQWVSLEVVGSGVTDQQGWVEFKATYLEDSKQRVMHEKSVFTLSGDCWLYIGGEITTDR